VYSVGRYWAKVLEKVSSRSCGVRMYNRKDELLHLPIE